MKFFQSLVYMNLVQKHICTFESNDVIFRRQKQKLIFEYEVKEVFSWTQEIGVLDNVLLFFLGMFERDIGCFLLADPLYNIEAFRLLFFDFPDGFQFKRLPVTETADAVHWISVKHIHMIFRLILVKVFLKQVYSFYFFWFSLKYAVFQPFIINFNNLVIFDFETVFRSKNWFFFVWVNGYLLLDNKCISLEKDCSFDNSDSFFRLLFGGYFFHFWCQFCCLFESCRST